MQTSIQAPASLTATEAHGGAFAANVERSALTARRRDTWAARAIRGVTRAVVRSPENRLTTVSRSPLIEVLQSGPPGALAGAGTVGVPLATEGTGVGFAEGRSSNRTERFSFTPAAAPAKPSFGPRRGTAVGPGFAAAVGATVETGVGRAPVAWAKTRRRARLTVMRGDAPTRGAGGSSEGRAAGPRRPASSTSI
jgi:hypothetical protein